MENVLRKLIELDQHAKEIVRPSENELSNLESIIKSKASEILDEIDKTLNKKIAQMRALSKEQIIAQKAEIDNETGIRLVKLEEEWDKNAHKWREEILSKIQSKDA